MEEVKNEVDIELQLAQKALAAAQARKAQAEEAARLAAQAALTKRLADEQERLARLKKEQEEADKRALDRRNAEAEAIRIADARRAAEQRRLEQEVEARNEAIRNEKARKEAVKKVAEEAQRVENDAKALEAALLKAQTPKEELKPPTLATTPLGSILGMSASQPAPAQGISSEENARLQCEADRIARVKVPARKAQPCVDTTSSNDVIKLVKDELHFNLNVQRADQWSSVWNSDALLAAVRKAIEIAKERPIGYDALCLTVESLLENGDA